MRCGLIFCHCIVKAIEYTGLIPRLLPPFGLYEKQEKQSGNETVNTGKILRMRLQKSGNETVNTGKSLRMRLQKSGNETGEELSNKAMQ